MLSTFCQRMYASAGNNGMCAWPISRGLHFEFLNCYGNFTQEYEHKVRTVIEKASKLYSYVIEWFVVIEKVAGLNILLVTCI